MKKVLLFIIIAVFSTNVFAQNASFDLTEYGVKIEPDKRLIVVLASLEAAGLETPLTEKGAEFRQQLKTDLQDLNPELRQKLKQFVDQYQKRHPKASTSEIIAPFISMAYVLTPVPDLAEPTRATDLPGDLLEVLDFTPLVREFYRRSTINTKLNDYVKIYQQTGDEMRSSAKVMVGDLLDYLHTKPQTTYIERIKTQTKAVKGKKTFQKTEIRERTRRFYIVPEMLATTGTINFLNVGDEYFAIVPPSTDLSSSEVRRGFLQFVLDPLVLKNAKDIAVLREGIKGLLDERRKANPDISPDIFITVLRSLIAAIDARQIEFEKTNIATTQARRKIDQMKTDKEKLAVSAELKKFKDSVADETALSLSEAYEKGAVLAFYFADQLKGLEDSGFDIEGSLRDMILSLDTTKEANRLAQFADARKRAMLAREERKANANNVPTIAENPVTKKLQEIETVTQAKNYQSAATQLKQLLQTNPNESPRIYYALGRVISLSAESATDVDTRNQRLLDAKVAYQNVVSSAEKIKTDATLLSLTYLALARIYEFDGDNSYAIKLYEAAIKFSDATSETYKQAVAARDRLVKN